jgi:hypothetical protein
VIALVLSTVLRNCGMPREVPARARPRPRSDAEQVAVAADQRVHA